MIPSHFMLKLGSRGTVINSSKVEQMQKREESSSLIKETDCKEYIESKFN